MAQKKKLQVFVSSTYTDLREERQAAVEAILTAGHIPAGMELFAAGDESQMNVIKRWIDESDVYLLILGGRYGTIEPKSQKSYIHLEYDYAVESGKPFFAIVIDEGYSKARVKTHPLSLDVVETENPQKLRGFRSQVTGKMVRFWSDSKDIKLAIMETLAEFDRREDLVGWIPGSESINTGALAEEIARLGKENAELRDQLAKLSRALVTYNGATFEEMYSLLVDARIAIESVEEKLVRKLQEVAKVFEDTDVGLVHALWLMRMRFQRRQEIFHTEEDVWAFADWMESFGLVEKNLETSRGNYSVYALTEVGKQFLLRLRLERDTSKAEQYVLDQD